MDKIIQKKFYFQEFNNTYGVSELTIPDGYQFLQFIQQENKVFVVFVEYSPIADVIAKLQKEHSENIKNYQKFLDEGYAKKISKLQMEKTFSDLITKFRIGDDVYFYQDSVGGWNKDENLEDHIKSMRLERICLTTSQVEMNDKDNDKSIKLIFSDWDNEISPQKAFRTRQDAIEGNKEYHELRMQKIKEQKEKAETQKVENKKKEEEEILRKAEEIRRNKNKD